MTYLRSARLLRLQVFFEPFCEYLNFNEVYTAITPQTENILIGPAEAQGGGISSRLESPEQLRYATLRPGKVALLVSLRCANHCNSTESKHDATFPAGKGLAGQ
jgi:hypothetical protein